MTRVDVGVARDEGSAAYLESFGYQTVDAHLAAQSL
jgi:hypothetical protein